MELLSWCIEQRLLISRYVIWCLNSCIKRISLCDLRSVLTWCYCRSAQFAAVIHGSTHMSKLEGESSGLSEAEAYASVRSHLGLYSDTPLLVEGR